MRTNKCFSLGFWHSNMASVFIILVGLLLPFSQVHAQEKKVPIITNGGVSFMFAYQKQSGILVKCYDYNNKACNRMLALIKRHRRDLQSGRSHLALTTYIRPSDLNDPRMINSASIQASVVKAYISVWTRVSHGTFTFVFDTAHYVNYQVRVDYISSPIPSSANRVIHYTLNRKPDLVLQSVKRYHPIPLADAFENRNNPEHPKLQSGQLATEADLTIVAQQQKAANEAKQLEIDQLHRQTSTTANLPADTTQQKATDATKPSATDQQRQAIAATVKAPAVTIQNKEFHPIKFSVKSNLLYWVGITPETEYHEVLPNAEVEWYLGKRWSLNIDGTYTYAKKSVVDKEIWGLSSIALEPRFWLKGNRRFTGFYAGVYGLTGDFDVKLGSISPHGYTGTFNEGDVSLGYLLPLSSRLGVEAGVRFGYRMVDCDTYKYVDPNHYYKQSSFTQNDFKVTGIRLLVTYRLWNSSKK